MQACAKSWRHRRQVSQQRMPSLASRKSLASAALLVQEFAAHVAVIDRQKVER